MMEANNNISNTSFILNLDQLPGILKNCAHELSFLIGGQIDKVLKIIDDEKQNASEVFGFQVSGINSDAQELYTFFANIWGSESKEQSVDNLVNQLIVLDQEIEQLESKHQKLKENKSLKEDMEERLSEVNKLDGDGVILGLQAMINKLNDEIEELESDIKDLEQKQLQKEKLEQDFVILQNPSIKPFGNGKFNLSQIENLIKNNNTFVFDKKMKTAEKKINLIEKSLKEAELNLQDAEKDLKLIKEKIEILTNKKSKNQEDIKQLEEFTFRKEDLEKQYLDFKVDYLEKQIELKGAHAEKALVYADQIAEFVSKAETIQKKFDQKIDISKMQKFRDGAIKLYENISEETKVLKEELKKYNKKTWGEFFNDLGEIFENSKKLKTLNEELAIVLKKIEKGEKIDEKELKIFANLLDNSSLFKGELSTKFMQFAQKHRNIMILLSTAGAVGLGYVMGSAFLGFGAKMLSDKYLKSLLPESESSSNLEKFGMGALETALSLVAGPYAAFSTAVAKVLQEKASEGVQTMVTATAVGLSIGGATGIGLGFLAGLIHVKPQLLTAMAADIQHVWKNIKEKRILTLFKDIILFVPKQLYDNCVGIKRSFTKSIDGKRHLVQAIIPIATIALAAGIIAASLWAIPLTIAIFYLVNKAFQERKYEGMPIFSNQYFRQYVANQLNGIDGEKRTLEEILKEEQVKAYNVYIKEAKRLNYHKDK